MDWITQFLGRLHPVLVHLPIGILFLAFIFECISQLKPYKKLRSAVQPALLIGVFFAIASAITGWYLSQEGGYEDDLLSRHKSLGIATAILGVVVYFLRATAQLYFQSKAKRKTFYLVLFIPLIILVSLTGHFGGSLTHGDDYLFASIETSTEVVDPAIKLQRISDLDNAAFYPDVIQPILESRCYSCHSSRKQKGELRLDGISFIEKGGEHGAILERGNSDSSSIFQRLMLSLEDDDHMPPNEKPQPSSSEIAMIQAWIDEGADFEMKISACKDSDKVKRYFSSLVMQSKKEALIPEDEVEQPDGKAFAALNEKGIITLPVSHESNYLSVSFVNRRALAPGDLQLLLPLKKQIVWLNLSRTTIADSSLNIIAGLSALRRLNLEFTSITDKGIHALSPLAELRYLNMVGTKITDESMGHLSELQKLEDLFIYQTDVTLSAIQKFKTAKPGVKIDTGGYALPKIITDSIVTRFKPL